MIGINNFSLVLILSSFILLSDCKSSDSEELEGTVSLHSTSEYSDSDDECVFLDYPKPTFVSAASLAKFSQAKLLRAKSDVEPSIAKLVAAKLAVEASKTKEAFLINILRSQVDGGDLDYIVSLGCLLIQRSEDEKREAVALFRQAANESDTIGMFNLAHCLQFGNGVEITEDGLEQALACYRRAHVNEYFPATVNFAYCLHNGIGFKTDKAERLKAIRIFRKAAEDGSNYCNLYLGYAYYSGKGVFKDTTKALPYLESTIEQWLVVDIIGSIYLMEKNYQEALYCYNRANSFSKKGFSTAPVDKDLLSYLNMRVSELSVDRKKDKKLNAKTRGSVSKEVLVKQQLGADCQVVLNRYRKLDAKLLGFLSNEFFMKKSGFNVEKAQADLKSAFDEFQKDVRKTEDLDMKGLEIRSFASDLNDIDELCFSAQQRVRSSSLELLLKHMLASVPLEASKKNNQQIITPVVSDHESE